MKLLLSAALLFFMSFATIWRSQYREEMSRMLLTIDEHAPTSTRVRGPLSNMQEFYDAFDVTPESKMWRKPEDRVKIW